MLSNLFCEYLRYTSGFFNYVLTSPAGMALFLSDLASGISLQASDFALADGHFYLPHYGVWLWHDSDDLSESGFAAAVAKYQYLAGKLFALRTMESRIFIVGNVQNNLTHDEMMASGRDFRLTAEIMSAIEVSVNALFPNGRNRVLFISSPDRAPGVAPERYFELPHQSADLGDDAVWHAFLSTLTSEPSWERRTAWIAGRPLRATIGAMRATQDMLRSFMP